MKFRGINHLALVTADMEATIRFWRDLMGMRLIHGFGEGDFRQYFFEIDEQSCLAFFEWDGAEPIAKKLHGQPISGPRVFDHIAFELDSQEEVWALKDKLEAAGFACSDMIDHDFIHSVYSFDPNGIPIEFCYEIKGREIRRKPVINDSSPPPAAQEGADPQPGIWPEVTQPTPEKAWAVKPGDSSGFFKK
ncbi:MAG: VOC family protein [Candidatus Electrothrix scaldis]|nr:MAG: VOC family protein [Candidatus Electrothrix sp. GW3-3]